MNLQDIDDQLTHIAAKLKRAKTGLQPGDVKLMEDILRDEIRWGSRGELSEYNPEMMTAIFDHRGDAMKYRRLLIRVGFDVSDVIETNVTEYEGLDFVIEIRDLV